MESQLTWVRIAIHGKKIRAGDSWGWRCFIGESTKETPLKDWSMEGKVLKSVNYIPGKIKPGTEDWHGLVGWIDVFGSCTIKDGILKIVLVREPPPLQPASYAQQ